MKNSKKAKKVTTFATLQALATVGYNDVVQMPVSIGHGVVYLRPWTHINITLPEFSRKMKEALNGL